MTTTTTGRGIKKLLVYTALACAGTGLASCSRTTPPAAVDDSVSLATVARAWPTQWSVVGTHSEATYVEQVAMTRRGDTFSLRIIVTAQGSQGGGLWSRTVRVDNAGHISDLDPTACGGDCAALDGTRGYLAAAALLSAQRSAGAPTHGVLRRFGAREVICVDGDQLYDAAGMPAGDSLQLDPCFDRGSGAVVAQYAPGVGTFSGPTLDTDTVRIALTPSGSAARP